MRELRVARGLSVRGLAAASGVDHSLLSRIERGVRPEPAPHVVLGILDALDEARPMLVFSGEALRAFAALSPMGRERLRRIRESVSFRLLESAARRAGGTPAVPGKEAGRCG